MLRKILAISFLFIYFTGLLQPALPMIEYYMYKESISELFCEERNNPDSDCEGTCYLSNQIEDQDKQDRPENLLNTDDVLVLLPVSELQVPRYNPPLASYLYSPASAPAEGVSPDLFQPPIL